MEHATIQIRSQDHKVQIEFFGDSNHGLSTWCSGCNVNICQQRCRNSISRSTKSMESLEVAQKSRHCCIAYDCITLKWDLALKNLEPCHIAHMDKLYKLAEIKRAHALGGSAMLRALSCRFLLRQELAFLSEIATLPRTSDARNQLMQAWSTMDGTRTHTCSLSSNFKLKLLVRNSLKQVSKHEELSQTHG